jgi:glycogen phosphorylase
MCLVDIEMLSNFAAQKIPNRIAGLTELSQNIWWSWHPAARYLFKSLDRPTWKASTHNPVVLLHKIAPYRLIAAAEDKEYLKVYDSVIRDYKYEQSADSNLDSPSCRDLQKHTVAYFSMEFALHRSIPIYAGGLGVLAGDYCKEASDLGLPVVCVGFMYPQGYFSQRISEEGWQQEIYRQINFDEAPVKPVLDDKRCPVCVTVSLGGRTIYIAVWMVNVGRVKLYLLDTHLEQNNPQDRDLTARLYGGDKETRIQQEMILGLGGVRMLRRLNVNPTVWHANEGHTSFMILERCRELVQEGMEFTQAWEHVQSTTVFTTHTPVPAGNDAFPHNLVEKYFTHFYKGLGISREAFLDLGTQSSDPGKFNMTVLGMRAANKRNGVSRLHGGVCRNMWHGLWPDLDEKDVPIISVTNGVHLPTWLAPQMATLYSHYLGTDWLDRQDDPAMWELVKNIPDEEIWNVRRWMKNKLHNEIRNRVGIRWRGDKSSLTNALAMGSMLNSEVLTIGFCRRFTDYKRPWLILSDIERLKKMVQNEDFPVQIVFSGKAHPDDQHGKSLIQQVYNLAKNFEFKGRVVFVEDYDLHLARYLVHGVDLWLNNPRPLQEASGTSGMKAAINGVPNLSILDGWWYEGYNGSNGWAIHANEDHCSSDNDRVDACSLFNLLENTIIPLYYERNRDGIPHAWLRVVKESIRSITPLFSARRMLKEYVEQMYLPCAEAFDGFAVKADLKDSSSLSAVAAKE